MLHSPQSFFAPLKGLLRGLSMGLCSVRQGACCVVALFFFSQPLTAWDFQVGVKKSRPALGAGLQTYESPQGKLTYQPNPMSSTLADNQWIGIQVDNWTGLYETADWAYPSEIQPAGALASQRIEMRMKEARIGLNYEMSRDLAGFFFGGGLSQIEESFTLNKVDYAFKKTVPYMRWGFDLIFDGLRVRVDQIQLKAGAHYLKINGVGALLTF